MLSIGKFEFEMIFHRQTDSPDVSIKYLALLKNYFQSQRIRAELTVFGNIKTENSLKSFVMDLESLLLLQVTNAIINSKIHILKLYKVSNEGVGILLPTNFTISAVLPSFTVLLPQTSTSLHCYIFSTSYIQITNFVVL